MTIDVEDLVKLMGEIEKLPAEIATTQRILDMMRRTFPVVKDVHYLFGYRVIVDPTIPPNTFELRAGDGTVLRVVNIGEDK